MISRSFAGLLALAAASGTACSASDTPSTPAVHTAHAHAHEAVIAGQPTAAATGLSRLEHPAAVCMQSDRYLGEREGVAVNVDGKTYHGCCASCAARIASRPELRVAIDPVTGRKIDKASAVVARDASHRLFYFESESSFAQAQASWDGQRAQAGPRP